MEGGLIQQNDARAVSFCFFDDRDKYRVALAQTPPHSVMALSGLANRTQLGRSSIHVGSAGTAMSRASSWHLMCMVRATPIGSPST